MKTKKNILQRLAKTSALLICTTITLSALTACNFAGNYADNNASKPMNETTVEKKAITQQAVNKAGKPNVIWVVLEDISLDLGAYGHPLVKTPNLDKIAKEGMRFNNAFATSSVCSTTRSAFFTGMHPTSIGAHHHRSHLTDNYQLPEQVKMLSEYTREAGYFNLLMGPKQKTDFNFATRVEPFDAMDGEIQYSGGAYTHGPVKESILNKPAWQKYLKQGEGKPFFAQINYSETHRTFINDVEDPIDVSLVKPPSYYPDHDIVKRDWALYLETVQHVDKKIGVLFNELEQAGALENTIVFIFGDHGRAMLRDKQWLYDGGIQVPLIAWGKGIEANTVNNDLVSLIDLAPTSLSLIGEPVPAYMDGKVILGKDKITREYIYAQRDRCDETDDRIRAVRDTQFKYIKNFKPEQPYTQFNAYKKLNYPVLTLMQKMHDAGELSPMQDQFFAKTRPIEELYDIKNDPEETTNLAANPKYQSNLLRMRAELERWQLETKDLGMIDEDPKVIAYWDEFFEKHYTTQMALRGLSTGISNEDYLIWWDNYLTSLEVAKN
ncbi:sulfatase [Colwellia sp. PAMC 21821]|uniref:sulfatase family protein n=1 Tax=Colwellia sp. PAMC 21821 TaxID=1816219 RepID=UPI0018C8C951|nr:sulfatase [Colwellia sp. PAMC 21821]